MNRVGESLATSQRLAALRVRFFDKCAIDRLALAAMWDEGDVVQLRTMAHRLAGSAGIFGAKELGEAARRLEAAIEIGAGLSELEPVYREIDSLLAAPL